MPKNKPFIVKLEDHTGEYGAVKLYNYEDGGNPDTMYAIGTLDSQGVIVLDDYFYWTLKAAQKAIA